jgi:hypothetical protein
MSAAQFPLSLENHYDSRYDRVAEIYSCWGDSLQHDPRLMLGAHHVPELAFIHAIRDGYRLGFVANSDSHDGHPGNAQGTPVRNHLFHHYGSGVTGVLVSERSRSAVLDALRARRSFAATAAGFAVATSLEGEPMGSDIPIARLPDHPTLFVEIVSDVPVASVEVYRGGYLVDTCRLTDQTARIEWIDDAGKPGQATSYFTRVIREDGETAWSSPHWVISNGSSA